MNQANQLKTFLARTIAVLVLTLFVSTMAWADGWISGGCDVTLVGGTLTVSKSSSGNGYMADYGAGELEARPWNESANSITSIVINNDVKSIGMNAFVLCTNLATVNFAAGSNLVDICPGAFSDSGLTSITIPSSVTSIGDYAFRNCLLTSITIPSSVTSIGDYAFFSCSYLSSIVIQAASLTTYGSQAFYGNKTRRKIFVPAASVDTYKTGWSDYADDIIGYNGTCGAEGNETNVVWALDGTSPNYTLYISGTGAMNDPFYHPWDSMTANITSGVIGSGVTSIGRYAFGGCTSLSSVTISSSVTSIGTEAFWNCKSLSSITIPSSVTSIGSGAFSSCYSLSSVTIPSSVTSIGDGAFSFSTSLSSINVDPSNEAFKSEDGVLFSKDGTKLVCYPGGKSGDYAIPSSVTSIGNKAFEDCAGLSSVTIPSSVTSIGDYAFFCCTSLSSVIIPFSVTSIGTNAFQECTSLSSITIPSSVTSIGDHAFSSCESLTSITIPSSVTSIGANVFLFCTNLKEVYVLRDNSTSITTLGIYVFQISDDLEIWVPSGALSDYKQAANWSRYANNLRGFGYCGDTYYDPKSIKNLFWTYNSTTKTLRIWKNATEPVGNSFDMKAYNTDDNQAPWYDDRASIENVVIEDGVTDIGNCAFYGCTALTTDHITMASSVACIRPYAFKGCTGLTTAPIGSTVKYIGDEAFGDCTGLISAHIPAGVEEVYDSNGKLTYNGNLHKDAFDGCTSMTTITVAEDNLVFKAVDGVLMSKDGTDIFKYPQGKTATSYTIPASVERIIEEAFSDCSSLTTLYVLRPEITALGYNALENCNALSNIYVHGAGYKTATKWSSFADKMKVLGTITPGNDVTVSGTATITSDGTAYYAEGAAITFSYGGSVTSGYDLGITVTKAGGGTVDVTETSGTYSFTMPGDDVTVAATKTAITYTITYNGVDGATFATANPESYTVDSDAITLCNPTKEGYVFVGWTGTGLTEATTTVTIAKGSQEAKSYTATWKKLLTNADIKVEAIADQTFTGSELKPAVVIKDGETDISNECEFTYSENIKVGNAKVTITAKTTSTDYSGETTTTFKITKPEPTSATVDNVTVVVIDEEEHTVEISGVSVEKGQTKVEIPQEVEINGVTYQVTAIADQVFQGQTEVTEIVLPDSDEPIQLGKDALKIDDEHMATVIVPQKWLGQYALDPELAEHVNAGKLKATVTPKNKYWTLACGVDILVPEGVTVYKARMNSTGTKVELTEIGKETLGGVLKANNGLLMTSTPGQDYDLVVSPANSVISLSTTDAKSYGEDNQLEPVLEDTHFASENYYILTENKFMMVDTSKDTKVPAGKAVLKVPAGASASRSLDIDDGDVTGIHAGMMGDDNEVWYNLQGQRISKPTRKGVYILNGKKVKK